MHIPALLVTTIFAGLLAACAGSGNPVPPSAPAAGGWGQPIAASGASPALPLRAQEGPPMQCVPEGGDCAAPQAQCCAGFTCAGISHSLCIPRH